MIFAFLRRLGLFVWGVNVMEVARVFLAHLPVTLVCMIQRVIILERKFVRRRIVQRLMLPAAVILPDLPVTVARVMLLAFVVVANVSANT
jgi:hypothetical protein